MDEPPNVVAMVRGATLRELSVHQLAGLHAQLETELLALADQLQLVETELNARS